MIAFETTYKLGPFSPGAPATIFSPLLSSSRGAVMRRLILSAVLLALVVGCGPSGSTNQVATPPPNAYNGQQQQQQPKPTDGRADGTTKKEEGK